MKLSWAKLILDGISFIRLDLFALHSILMWALCRLFTSHRSTTKSDWRILCSITVNRNGHNKHDSRHKVSLTTHTHTHKSIMPSKANEVMTVWAFTVSLSLCVSIEIWGWQTEHSKCDNWSHVVFRSVLLCVRLCLYLCVKGFVCLFIWCFWRSWFFFLSPPQHFGWSPQSSQ